MRADPSDPQSWNRYAYVQNLPLTAVDPDGLDIWDEWGGGGGGFGINIGFGSGGFSIGGGIFASMNCMGVPCQPSALVQTAQAVAQAIKTRNWASLVGLGLGSVEQGLMNAASSDSCDFGVCDNGPSVPGAMGMTGNDYCGIGYHCDLDDIAEDFMVKGIFAGAGLNDLGSFTIMKGRLKCGDSLQILRGSQR